MLKKIFIAFVISNTLAYTVIAQENKQYTFHQFGHETVLFIKQPGKWRGGDLLKLGAVGVGVVLAMQIDTKVRAVVFDHPKYAKSLPMEIGNQWGGFFTTPILAVGLYGIGCISGNTTTKKLGFEIAQGALYSEAVSFIAKGIVGRTRPFMNRGMCDYQPFRFFDSPYNSFPAGHLDAAFAMSTVLSKNAHSTFLKVLAYAPAALTVASRIYQDVHWTSDVVAGACLGYFVGSWVVNLHEKNDSRVQVSNIYPLTLKIALN